MKEKINKDFDFSFIKDKKYNNKSNSSL